MPGVKGGLYVQACFKFGRFKSQRVLCRHYDGINSLYIESQLRFQSVLDLLFPYYSNVFSALCGDSSLHLLAAFPTPESVLAAAKEDVLALLKAEYQRKGWVENIYDKLLAAAKASLPYKVSQQSNIRVLREYIGILMTHKAQLAEDVNRFSGDHQLTAYAGLLTYVRHYFKQPKPQYALL
ncbi:hypothetical protein [Phosphitispora fastidiosa]|uniref:hypothetical protein n=1 Tax=Phosphitispora fastidiosa TaxID=2837202 RepID=UPI001E35C3F6|nr:hypothetical protein [Phosphitispora fastidiosa]MBU7006598.1 hypothetical protein [Phosphitispora fastidiosa]